MNNNAKKEKPIIDIIIDIWKTADIKTTPEYRKLLKRQLDLSGVNYEDRKKR